MNHCCYALAPDHDRGWEQAFSDMVYWKFEGVPTDTHVRSHVGFMERVLELKPGDAVLDLGCGLGQHCIELARRGYEVTGLDWSAAFLAEGRQRLQEAGVAARLTQGDMSQLSFAGEFDAVVLWGNTFGMLAHEDNERTLGGYAGRSNRADER